MPPHNVNNKGNNPGRFIIKIVFLVLLLVGLFGLITGRMFKGEYGNPILNLYVLVIFPIFYLWPEIVKLVKNKEDKP